MKKLPLVLAISAALPLTAIAKPFVAKNVGQGFTGTTGDFTHAQYNPALLANFDEDDDLFFTLGGGVIASDKDDLIDSIEDTQDLIDEIDERLNSNGITVGEARAEAQKVVDAMSDLDMKTLTLDEGLNLTIAIPMEWASLALYVNQEARLGTHFDYDEVNDTVDNIEDSIIDNIETTGSVDFADTLKSNGVVLGFSVTEAGLSIAKSWKSAKYDVHYGTSLKYQRIDIFNYAASINDFDDDDFDADDYLADDNQFNIDLGVQIVWGEERNWQAGLVAKNLMGFDLESQPNPVDGSIYQFELDPSATAGIAYDNDWFRFSVDADLIAHSEFNTLGEVQYTSVGMELDAWEWAQLRLGYRSDMKSNVDDVISAGIGLSPFDVLSLDISAVAGENDTYGAAVQLGLKF